MQNTRKIRSLEAVRERERERELHFNEEKCSLVQCADKQDNNLNTKINSINNKVETRLNL